MRVLVCGGRDYSDFDKVADVLNGLRNEGKLSVVIQGGAFGADALAKGHAATLKVPCITFRAEWGKYGKRAGYLRNVRMLEEGKPDMVVAFPGGRGTAMMIQIAKEAGVPVMEIE